MNALWETAGGTLELAKSLVEQVTIDNVGEEITEGKIVQVVSMQELRMSLASFDCPCKEADCRLSTKHHIDQVGLQWMLA